MALHSKKEKKNQEPIVHFVGQNPYDNTKQTSINLKEQKLFQQCLWQQSYTTRNQLQKGN